MMTHLNQKRWAGNPYPDRKYTVPMGLYKIFDNFLHFYNKICPNFYIYKNLEKSFNLQPDILKFYNI